MGGEKFNKRFYLPVFFKLVLLIWVSFKHGHFIDGKMHELLPNKPTLSSPLAPSCSGCKSIQNA